MENADATRAMVTVFAMGMVGRREPKGLGRRQMSDLRSNALAGFTL